MVAMRIVRIIVVLVAASAALLLPTGATAANASTWHVDFLVAYRATGQGASAAPAQWTTAGSVATWEVDVDADSVALSWVQADGNMGAYTWPNRSAADGQPHRIHLDAQQAGPDIVATLTVSGFAIKPIAVPGQQIGHIIQLAASPAHPLRQATFTASVADLTGWNN